MIEKVRGLVDQALDWLVDKAVSAGTAFLNMVQSGVDTVRSGISNLREWWSSKEPVTTQDGQNHEIGFTGSGSSANLIIRSSPPQPYSAYLTGIKSTYNLTDAQINPALSKAREIETEKQKTVPEDQQEAHGQNINALVRQLADLTRTLPLSGSAGTNTAPVFGPLHQGLGTLARVVYLQSPHDTGNNPTVGNTPEYDDINARRMGGGSYYVKGHLLNENLGGPGNTWSNLTPLTQTANGDHKRQFENPVKQAVNGKLEGYSPSTLGHMKQFQVQAVYGRTPDENLIEKLLETDDAIPGLDDSADRADVAKVLRAERFVPTQLNCSAEITEQGGSPRQLNVPITNNISYGQMSQYSMSASSRSRYVLAEKIDFSKSDVNDATAEVRKLELIGAGRAQKMYTAFMTRGRIQSYVGDIGVGKQALERNNPRYRFVGGVKP